MTATDARFIRRPIGQARRGCEGCPPPKREAAWSAGKLRARSCRCPEGQLLCTIHEATASVRGAFFNAIANRRPAALEAGCSKRSSGSPNRSTTFAAVVTPSWPSREDKPLRRFGRWLARSEDAASTPDPPGQAACGAGVMARFSGAHRLVLAEPNGRERAVDFGRTRRRPDSHPRPAMLARDISDPPDGRRLVPGIARAKIALRYGLQREDLELLTTAERRRTAGQAVGPRYRTLW